MWNFWQSMSRSWGKPQRRNGMGFFPAFLLGTGIGMAAIGMARNQGIRRNIFSRLIPTNRTMQPSR